MSDYEQLGLFDDVLEEYTITKPVRLISFFSGIEAQFKALSFLGKRINVSVESYKTCEWAYNSIVACNAIHNRDFTDYSEGKTKEEMINRIRGISVDYNKPLTDEQLNKKPLSWIKNAYNNCIANHNLINIMDVHGKDLEIEDNTKHNYILTYSFPCVTKDSLILTEKGYVPFEEIKVGDKVLTKSNTWQKVNKVFDNGIHNIYKVYTTNYTELKCTANHKILSGNLKIKSKYTYLHRKRDKYLGIERKIVNTEWKEAKELTNKDFVVYPIIQEEVSFYTNDNNFWYIVGRYIADGCVRKGKKVICFSCNDKKLSNLENVIKNTKFKYKSIQGTTCKELNIYDNNFYEFLMKNIGRGSGTKFISMDILKLPIEQLKSLLQGYLDGDGHLDKKKRNTWSFSSINKNLILYLSKIIAKCYHIVPSITFVKENKRKRICNVECNVHSWYNAHFVIGSKYTRNSVWYDNKLWTRVRKVIDTKLKENVYDIEVDNEHDFDCEGICIHNCQDLSLAGKRAGMDVSQKEGGTRSGLLWEVERILQECKDLGEKHLPNLLVLENVPQIHSAKDMPNFIKWQQRLEELGYVSFWKDLNAKDYGIPQNRDRTFMISLYGKNYHYKFPNTFKRQYTLKDFLEKQVDEKYYLSRKMIDYLTGVNQKESKFNRGSRFESSLKLTNEENIAGCITTAAGQRPTDNFIKEEYKGTYDYAQSETLRPTESDRFHEDNEVSGTILASGNQNGIAIKILNNTEEGYLEAHEGDGINISSRMHHQRGNVQQDMAQTLKTTMEVGVVVNDNAPEKVGYIEKGTGEHQSNTVYSSGGLCPALTASDKKEPIKMLVEENYSEESLKRIKNNVVENDTAPTITANAMQSINHQNCALIKEEEESLFTETEANLFTEDGNIRRYIGSDKIDEFKEGQMATTTFPNGYGHGTRTHNESVTLNTIDRPVVKQNLRIRKLTPKEALRLMAFTDEDYYHVKETGLGDGALYHMAGDSICVNVLVGILGKLFGLTNRETENIVKDYIETIRQNETI